jgi:hypothetical protein
MFFMEHSIRVTVFPHQEYPFGRPNLAKSSSAQQSTISINILFRWSYAYSGLIGDEAQAQRLKRVFIAPG